MLPILVDSGADHAFCRAEFAKTIGLRYEDGEAHSVGGIGNAPYWLHRGVGLEIRAPDGSKCAIEIDLGFILDLRIQGILGRKDFFEAFDVLVKERDQEVILTLH